MYVRLLCGVIGFVAISVWFSPSVGAQTAQSLEYMQATSPLKSGGTITSRSLPGRAVETFISGVPTAQTSYPAALANGSTTSGFRPAGQTAGNSPTQAVATTQSPAPAFLSAPSTTTYPYPGQALPNYPVQTYQPQNPQLYQGQYIAPNSTWIPATAAPQAAWQVPTLGINSNTVLRPNISALSVPPQSVDPSAASLAPGLNIEVPGSTTASTATPTILYPQSALPYPNPNLPGTANRKLQPLIKLKNLPPGTYVGQGIVGQPKAYVDGQPVRNLFRYIMP